MGSRYPAGLKQSVNPAGADYRWWYCKGCHRVYEDNRKNLLRHMGHGEQRIAGDEAWYHILYCPKLLIEWLRLKLTRLSE